MAASSAKERNVIMPTYSAEFHTDAEWALLDIKATTPEKALAKAALR